MKIVINHINKVFLTISQFIFFCIITIGCDETIANNQNHNLMETSCSNHSEISLNQKNINIHNLCEAIKYHEDEVMCSIVSTLHKDNINKTLYCNEPLVDRKIDLMTAALLYGNQYALKALHQKGADFNKSYLQGSNLVHWGVLFNQVNMIGFLHKLNVNLDKRDHRGRTPFDHALKLGYTQVGLELINLGIDLHSQNGDKTPSLHLASFYLNFEIVKQLVEHNKVSIYQLDSQGRTALDYVFSQLSLIVKENSSVQNFDVFTVISLIQYFLDHDVPSTLLPKNNQESIQEEGLPS